MVKSLININRYFANHRAVFYLVFVASFAILAWFALHVKYEEDISKIIPKDEKIDKLNEIFEKL